MLSLGYRSWKDCLCEDLRALPCSHGLRQGYDPRRANTIPDYDGNTMSGTVKWEDPLTPFYLALHLAYRGENTMAATGSRGILPNSTFRPEAHGENAAALKLKRRVHR